MGKKDSWREKLQPNPYWTPPEFTRVLMERVKFPGPVWEPCFGGGWLAEVVANYGHSILTSDIYQYGLDPDFYHDIITGGEPKFPGDVRPKSIITNPPFTGCAHFLKRLMRTPGVQRCAFLTQGKLLDAYLRDDVRGEFGLRLVIPLRKGWFFDYAEQKARNPQYPCCWFVMERGWTEDARIAHGNKLYIGD